MSILPKFDEFIEVRRRNSQNSFHIAAARIPGPHGIVSIRQRNISLRYVVEFQDDLNLRIESMHMTGLVIFEICDKPDAIEPNRAHAYRIL